MKDRANTCLNDSTRFLIAIASEIDRETAVSHFAGLARSWPTCRGVLHSSLRRRRRGAGARRMAVAWPRCHRQADIDRRGSRTRQVAGGDRDGGRGHDWRHVAVLRRPRAARQRDHPVGRRRRGGHRHPALNGGPR